MKSFLFLAVILISFQFLTAQPVQFTTTRGTLVNTSTNRVSVYAKPATELPNKLYSTIQFCVSIPDQGTNNPIATLDSHYVSNLNWTQLTPVSYNSRRYYTFQGIDNAGTTTTSWNDGNNKIVTLLFSSNVGLSDIQLNDESPSFGSNSNLGWYVELIHSGNGDITDYLQKFYGNSPSPTNNINSPSFVGLQPISFLQLMF